MGLDIRVLKLKEYRGKADTEDTDDCSYVYTLDSFEPIKHLTKFKEGYYDNDRVGEHFQMPYSTFNRFRRCICQLALGVDCEAVWNNIDSYLDKPFVELINFADNEGDFDYEIAKNLLEDFYKYKDKAKELTECDYNFYESYLLYILILEKCVEVEGVVHYF